MRNASMVIPKSCSIQPPATAKSNRMIQGEPVCLTCDLESCNLIQRPGRESEDQVWLQAGFTTMMIEEKLSSAKLPGEICHYDQVCGGFDIICCGLARMVALYFSPRNRLWQGFFHRQALACRGCRCDKQCLRFGCGGTMEFLLGIWVLAPCAARPTGRS